MCNFIEDLDVRYREERRENKIKRADRDFACNIPLRVKLYGKTNDHFIIRKRRFTRFLYTKNGCRVHFSDADILTMLLQLQNKDTVDLLLEKLENAYRKCDEKFTIRIGMREGVKEYEIEGISQVEDEQILINPQDIDISFDDLLVLMNLILAKDQASSPLWPNRPDFFKHTVSKYISLLKYYYYGDQKAKKYLMAIGYSVDEDIYSNYNTSDKRDEKRGLFTDFELFEKSGLL